MLMRIYEDSHGVYKALIRSTAEAASIQRIYNALRYIFLLVEPYPEERPSLFCFRLRSIGGSKLGRINLKPFPYT